MSQPTITYVLDWAPYNNTSGKISTNSAFYVGTTLIDPAKVDIKITSAIAFKHLYCRATLADEECGIEIGQLVGSTSFTNRPAGTYTITLNAINDLISGEGVYRISIYIQDQNGVWNYENFLLSTEAGGEHFILKDSDGNLLKAYADDDIGDGEVTS